MHLIISFVTDFTLLIMKRASQDLLSHQVASAAIDQQAITTSHGGNLHEQTFLYIQYKTMSE